MPMKRGKFNARFPTARIKKIMQLDDDVGKVAATVPPVVSRALELFVENLMRTAFSVALRRQGSKTITPSHLKYVIESDEKLEFARKLVVDIPVLKFGKCTTEDDCDEDSDVDKDSRVDHSLDINSSELVSPTTSSSNGFKSTTSRGRGRGSRGPRGSRGGLKRTINVSDEVDIDSVMPIAKALRGKGRGRGRGRGQQINSVSSANFTPQATGECLSEVINEEHGIGDADAAALDFNGEEVDEAQSALAMLEESGGELISGKFNRSRKENKIIWPDDDVDFVEEDDDATDDDDDGE